MADRERILGDKGSGEWGGESVTSQIRTTYDTRVRVCQRIRIGLFNSVVKCLFAAGAGSNVEEQWITKFVTFSVKYSHI